MDEQTQHWWLSRWNRMRISIGLLVVLGIAALGLTWWLRGGGGEEHAGTGAALREGQVAPDFSLPAASGAAVSLGGFRGQPVLLYFSMGSG